MRQPFTLRSACHNDRSPVVESIMEPMGRKLPAIFVTKDHLRGPDGAGQPRTTWGTTLLGNIRVSKKKNDKLKANVVLTDYLAATLIG